MKVTQYRLKPGLKHIGYVNKKKILYTGGDMVPLSAGGIKAFGDKFDTIITDTAYTEPVVEETKDEQPDPEEATTTGDSSGADENDEGADNGDDTDGTEAEPEAEEEDEEPDEEIPIEAVHKGRGRWIVQTVGTMIKQHKKYIKKQRAETWVETGTDPGV